MPRNVFIVLFTYIIVSNDEIQLQISALNIMVQMCSPCSIRLNGKTVTKTRLELNAEVMVVVVIIIIRRRRISR
jgi:hypothetical protein